MNSSGVASTSLFFRDESQDVREYLAIIDTSNPSVVMDPLTNNYDAVSLRNTSGFPILATVTLLEGKGANQTANDKKILLDVREMRVVDYSAEVVDRITLQELDETSIIAVDGVVDVDALTGLSTPSSTIYVRSTFFNS